MMQVAMLLFMTKEHTIVPYIVIIIFKNIYTSGL